MTELITVAPGEFEMQAHGRRNVTKSRITISDGFKLSRHLVTQELWLSIMGSAPWKSVSSQLGYMEGSEFPAVGMTWQEAVSFCEELSRREVCIARLPTEAQWEYAIRAGTTTEYFWGDDYTRATEYAWVCNGPFEDSVLHKVGLIKPNPWGLFDMAGNVREWVRDRCEMAKNGPFVAEKHYPKVGTNWFSPKGSFGIVRNASFRASMVSTSSHFNMITIPTERNVEYGFRFVVEEH